LNKIENGYILKKRKRVKTFCIQNVSSNLGYSLLNWLIYHFWKDCLFCGYA